MAERPTMLIAGVDRNRTYFFWEWIAPTPGDQHAYVVDAEPRDALLARLTEALPIETPGETTAKMLKRVLGSGALADPVSELALSTELAELLLPADLRSELVAAYEDNDRRPVLLRLMPSASTAAVPWELLPVTLSDGTEARLIEVADLVLEVPAGVHVGRAKSPDAWRPDGAVLYIVDPVNRASAPVLDDEAQETFRAIIAKRGTRESRVNAEFTRRDLNLALVDTAPSRLFYVGHVVQDAAVAGSSSLLLSDPDDTFGVSPIYQQASRPLSALDLFEGTQNWERRVQQIADEGVGGRGRLDLKWPITRETRRAGARIWPMPPRVALVACKSGSDMVHSEPFGLAIALINAGAELVTATKWTLPTDFAYKELLKSSARPLTNASTALDDAHGGPDPVAEFATWQRERLAAWRSADRQHGDAPLIWAAFSHYVAIQRQVESVLPVTESIRLVET